MGLLVEITANGEPLSTIAITRRLPSRTVVPEMSSNSVNTYKVERFKFGRERTIQHTVDVEHRYGDGHVALVSKALEALKDL